MNIIHIKKAFAKSLKFVTWLLSLAFCCYAFMCIYFYNKQETILFHPQQLSSDYRFKFPGTYNEKFITATDGTLLHGLLFTTDSAKGVILYLHGNAGSLATWGEVAQTYTRLNYNVFILDYRGFGKSAGKITCEQQIFNDDDIIYNELEKEYSERQIVVLGYSIGTCLAARLAATHHPGRLILQAPYYSMIDLAKQRYPFLPSFLLKYPLLTYVALAQVHCPITIFHGDSDKVIDIGESFKLKQYVKQGDSLIVLHGQGHSGITDNAAYRNALISIL